MDRIIERRSERNGNDLSDGEWCLSEEVAPLEADAKRLALLVLQREARSGMTADERADLIVIAKRIAGVK